MLFIFSHIVERLLNLASGSSQDLLSSLPNHFFLDLHIMSLIGGQRILPKDFDII